jgi:predicted metal-dependent HD superfamily phosphohydrolase
MQTNDFPAPLDDAALADTWASAWAELGRAVPLALGLELQTAWSEAHRHYHNEVHLRECMALWLLWQPTASYRPRRVRS